MSLPTPPVPPPPPLPPLTGDEAKTLEILLCNEISGDEILRTAVLVLLETANRPLSAAQIVFLAHKDPHPTEIHLLSKLNTYFRTCQTMKKDPIFRRVVVNNLQNHYYLNLASLPPLAWIHPPLPAPSSYTHQNAIKRPKNKDGPKRNPNLPAEYNSLNNLEKKRLLFGRSSSTSSSSNSTTTRNKPAARKHRHDDDTETDDEDDPHDSNGSYSTKKSSHRRNSTTSIPVCLRPDFKIGPPFTDLLSSDAFPFLPSATDPTINSVVVPANTYFFVQDDRCMNKKKFAGDAKCRSCIWKHRDKLPYCFYIGFRAFLVKLDEDATPSGGDDAMDVDDNTNEKAGGSSSQSSGDVKPKTIAGVPLKVDPTNPYRVLNDVPADRLVYGPYFIPNAESRAGTHAMSVAATASPAGVDGIKKSPLAGGSLPRKKKVKSEHVDGSTAGATAPTGDAMEQDSSDETDTQPSTTAAAATTLAQLSSLAVAAAAATTSTSITAKSPLAPAQPPPPEPAPRLLSLLSGTSPLTAVASSSSSPPSDSESDFTTTPATTTTATNPTKRTYAKHRDFPDLHKTSPFPFIPSPLNPTQNNLLLPPGSYYHIQSNPCITPSSSSTTSYTNFPKCRNCRNQHHTDPPPACLYTGFRAFVVPNVEKVLRDAARVALSRDAECISDEAVEKVYKGPLLGGPDGKRVLCRVGAQDLTYGPYFVPGAGVEGVVAAVGGGSASVAKPGKKEKVKKEGGKQQVRSGSVVSESKSGGVGGGHSSRSGSVNASASVTPKPKRERPPLKPGEKRLSGRERVGNKPLPPNWTKTFVFRLNGQKETTYHTPEGVKLRSYAAVRRYCEDNEIELNEYDVPEESPASEVGNAVGPPLPPAAAGGASPSAPAALRALAAVAPVTQASEPPKPLTVLKPSVSLEPVDDAVSEIDISEVADDDSSLDAASNADILSGAEPRVAMLAAAVAAAVAAKHSTVVSEAVSVPVEQNGVHTSPVSRQVQLESITVPHNSTPPSSFPQPVYHSPPPAVSLPPIVHPPPPVASAPHFPAVATHDQQTYHQPYTAATPHAHQPYTSVSPHIHQRQQQQYEPPAIIDGLSQLLLAAVASVDSGMLLEHHHQHHHHHPHQHRVESVSPVSTTTQSYYGDRMKNGGSGSGSGAMHREDAVLHQTKKAGGRGGGGSGSVVGKVGSPVVSAKGVGGGGGGGGKGRRGEKVKGGGGWR
ncbi:hypothetical protein HDU98_003415 [Podochytrium sp. JEL0797]|nr:hypothetical protein HDU98_003415 [Podochytrium sp. JEL0797]